MKRPLALLFAAAVLAAGWAGTRTVDAGRVRAVRREAARAAEGAGQRASEALASHVRELKLEAQNAASNPRLVAALRGNADAATLADLFRTEEWWEPYRNAFKVYAVAFQGDRLDVLEGMKTADFAADLLIRKARAGREVVAEIVMGKGWPYAAAAAAVEMPGRAIPAVLLLAKPVDEAVIRRLADRAHGAVLLSDGSRAVLEAGPDGERALLRKAVGAEAKGPLYEPDASWAAVVSPLVPGLWLWTYATGGAASHEAESAANTASTVIWLVAGLLALGGLFFGLRRAPTPARVAETQVGLGPEADFPGRGLAEAAPRSKSAALGQAATEVLSSDVTTRGGDAGRAIRFGRYLLLDQLGEGGMAQVYTAVTFGAEGFRRTFVVKRLRAELNRDPAIVAQFIDEANLGSTLVHSNIVPVFDFGKVGEEYFLAQEYILGRDLGRLTARQIERNAVAVPPTVVLHAAAETLRALEYAHTKLGEGGRPLGIVHRDVSPSNILLSARGEVKLFDFGIVKAEGRVTKTQHGVVKGNVSFMSPEQARGFNVDGRADLFSLGLVIYYCLTGDVLYHGQTTYELLVKAATGPGPEELDRLAALPAPCAAILGRALQVEPSNRFQTAAEFAAALAPHTAGGAAASAALMGALFSADFRAEEARFNAAVPANDRPAPALNAPDTRRS